MKPTKHQEVFRSHLSHQSESLCAFHLVTLLDVNAPAG